MIDLRSDTVTRPTAGMLEAMTRAKVGDDVYGEDPSCRELEERVADLLGHQAALFTVSGSLANQLGVRTLVDPGQELLCEASAHIVRAEHGAHAAVAGVTTRTWRHPHGQVDLTALDELMVPDGGAHLVSTAAIAVENTHNFGGGTVQPLEVLRELRTRTSAVGVGLHLDGARLWNAAVATGIPAHDYAQAFDTVAVCLSKGLGAPVGSLLVGAADRIARARVWRSRAGAAWRQAGVLAAAGLYALDHHVERLAEDHQRAGELARTVASVAPGVIDPDLAQTNMCVLDLRGQRQTAADVVERARDAGVLVSVLGPRMVRLVTHLDVSTDDCRRAGDILSGILSV